MTSAKFPVVAIGASAGGLKACQMLLDAVPAANRMAFIVVQHLDPNHDSMMADLLAGHTRMPVAQASDGMTVEREHVYVIPPGVHISGRQRDVTAFPGVGASGDRRPFDFLLESVAREYGARSVCVILSGTGSDGSEGLKAIKEQGGLVIAQDINEAEYGGMPESAVATGHVEYMLPVAKIAEALVARESGVLFVAEPQTPPSGLNRWKVYYRRSSLFSETARPITLEITSAVRWQGGSSGV